MSVEERAREFILSRTQYATDYAANLYAQDFAEFAKQERAAAVREFAYDLCLQGRESADKKFREMFQEDL